MTLIQNCCNKIVTQLITQDCNNATLPFFEYLVLNIQIFSNGTRNGRYILTIKKLSWTVTTCCPSKPQNRDYNRSLIQVYNVAPLLHCACYSTHPISLLGRWRWRLSLVCNNQNHETSLKMLDGYRTSDVLWRFDGWKLLSRFRFTC